MCTAFVPDQQAVTLRVVAAAFGFGVHGHQSTIGVLRNAGRYPFGHNPRFCVFAKMHHFRARIGLLVIVGNRDGIKLPLAIVTAQNAGRIFPCHRRSSFHLCPHDF